MNNRHKPNSRRDEAAADNMLKRVNDLFAGQEPPSYVSIREVDAMKARISELEMQLVDQETKTATANQTLQKTTVHAAPLRTVETRMPEPLLPSNSSKKTTRLSRFWGLLTEAHASLTEVGERNSARLAASFLLTITLLQVVSGFFRIPRVGLANAFSGAILFSLLPTLFAYLLARTKWYRGAIFIFSLAFGALAYITILNQGNDAHVSGLVLVYVPLSLIVASTFLSSWAVLLLTVLNIIGFIFSTRVGIPNPTESFGSQPGIMITIGVVLIILSNFRKRNEQLRMDELKQVNQQLESARTNLEQRVTDRTHDLELASEIGRSIAEKINNLSEMLTNAAETIRSKFDLYYTQVYLVDTSGRNLVLRAGTGDVGVQLLRRGHRLALSANSLNSRAASSQQPVLVDDTQKSANFLPNPLLPLTRSELSVPLVANNTVVGVLDMQSERPETFSEVNLPAFQVLASQLAIAIQNSLLFDKAEDSRLEVEEQARRLTSSGWREFLNAVARSETIGYVFDQDEVLPVVTLEDETPDHALAVPIQITGAEVGEIRLVDETSRQWTKSEAEIVEAAAAHMAQHIENLRLIAQAEQYRAEAEQVSRRLTSEGWKEFLRTRTELADGYTYNQNQVQPMNGNGHNPFTPAMSFPVVVRDEQIGEFTFDTNGGSNESDSEFITAVIEQLSDHIESLRLLEQAEQKRLELETVATVSSTASTVLDPDKLLQAVVDLTKERFGLYHAQIYLADKRWNTLLLASGAGEVGRTLVAQEHAISMDAEKSLVARAARERESVIANDVKSQPDFLPNPLLPDTRAEMAVPMIVGDNVLGVFDVQSNHAGGFTKEDANIYSTLASQVAVALQNARLYVEQAATVTQLRELDRLKSSFLANMSHELRTPMNSILGFTDVMLEGLDGTLTENMDNDLRLIQKNGQHLLHLINDVLDMAKIESGTMNLNLETFKVQSVFDEVMSITSTLASDKNLSLSVAKGSDRSIEVYADNTRLRQVMINLVNNAIKFTETGKIMISATPMDGARVLISVKDTGIGIPPDTLEAVFQEFTQVDSSTTRKAGGTGLGLPISRRLVEMHGGRLWAESAGIPGEGSTFFVEMPLEARITEVVEKQGL